MSQPSAMESALRWFLRLREPDCSEDERRSFEQWLAADASHRAEFEAIGATWDGLDPVAKNPSTELARRVKRLTALPPVKKAPEVNAKLRSSPALWIATAAVMLLVSGTAWWWSAARIITTGYHTAKGEERLVTLADGTLMDLNTETDVTVQMSGRLRRITVQSGDAYFTVARDSRPFEVIASNGHINDIGTQFSVSKRSNRVEVAVETGAVRVDLSGEAPSSSHMLRSGERVSYMADGTFSTLERLEAAHIASWRHGTLRFDGVPLAEALAEVERYWPGRILLTDPALGNTRIRGVFNHHDLGEFFTALPNIMAVHVTHRGGDRLISRRQDPQ